MSDLPRVVKGGKNNNEIIHETPKMFKLCLNRSQKRRFT